MSVAGHERAAAGSPRTAASRSCKVEGVKKYFPITQGIMFQQQVGDVHAVDGVDLEIYPGETSGWSGRPGAASRRSLAS